MDYLDLVEEYEDGKPINQFEKVRVLASRTRDLYQEKACKLPNLEDRKPTTKAQYELAKELIRPHVYLKDERETYQEEYLEEEGAN